MRKWMLVLALLSMVKPLDALGGIYCEAICLGSSDFAMLERSVTVAESVFLQNHRVIGSYNITFKALQKECKALTEKDVGTRGTFLLVEFSPLTGKLVPASPANVCNGY